MAVVREDMPARAIWTVAVVSQSVVVDHHHHPSWELELVEAPETVIADVTAHTMDPRLLLSRHQLVVELEAILVEIQADLAVQERLRARRERQDHQEGKIWR